MALAPKKEFAGQTVQVFSAEQEKLGVLLWPDLASRSLRELLQDPSDSWDLGTQVNLMFVEETPFRLDVEQSPRLPPSEEARRDAREGLANRANVVEQAKSGQRVWRHNDDLSA